MSMATLERAILANARVFFKNSKLRQKDIREWSTGEVEAASDEVVVYLPDPGVYVAIFQTHDKRK